jgi:L-alanine-DL-glutamate epimerase-like enolase superfamily enzyme
MAGGMAAGFAGAPKPATGAEAGMASVYHLYNDLYPHFIKNVPVPVSGYVTAPDGPGLGIELRDEPFRNGDAVVETIAEL